MKIPRLQQSCCGCSVIQGALILGWLQTIGSVLMAITSFASIFLVDEIVEEKHNGDSSTVAPDLSTEDAALMKIKFVTGFITCSVMSAIYILFLIGIRKRNSCLMMPTVIVGAIGLGVLIFAAVLCLIIAFFDPVTLLSLPVIGIEFAIGGYFWLIIYSAYMEISEADPSTEGISTFHKM